MNADLLSIWRKFFLILQVKISRPKQNEINIWFHVNKNQHQKAIKARHFYCEFPSKKEEDTFSDNPKDKSF